MHLGLLLDLVQGADAWGDGDQIVGSEDLLADAHLALGVHCQAGVQGGQAHLEHGPGVGERDTSLQAASPGLHVSHTAQQGRAELAELVGTGRAATAPGAVYRVGDRNQDARCACTG